MSELYSNIFRTILQKYHLSALTFDILQTKSQTLLAGQEIVVDAKAKQEDNHLEHSSPKEMTIFDYLCCFISSLIIYVDSLVY